MFFECSGSLKTFPSKILIFMMNDRNIINNLLNRYLWHYPFILNVVFLLFHFKYQSLIIAFGCLAMCIHKMYRSHLKPQKYIVFFDLKGILENKKLFLIRLFLFAIGICLLWMTWIAENTSWVCGTYCFHSQLAQQFMQGMSYTCGLYLLFLAMIDVKK